jgi:hypothetical protein
MERKIVEQLVSGKGFNAICRDLKVGKNRVAHIKEKAREYGYLDGNTPIPPYPEAIFPDPVDGRSLKTSEADLQLQGQRQWIEDRLQAGWQPITIFEELPVNTGRSSFYRFLRRHKLNDIGENARRRLIEEIIYAPAEALIIDWGKLRDVLDPETGKKRIVWMFIGVLGYSRYMMVHLVWSYDVPSTLSTLEEMLKELGGVPKRSVSDNPKCFALEASKYEPLLNPVYERFAAHYGATIECLPPGSPELKGRVERMVPFGRRLYQAHGNGWYGLIESQQYMNKKVAIANERIHGTTRRRAVDVFSAEEAPALKPLPAIAYEIEEFHEGTVRKDGHVRFRSKYYSVEERYRDQKVTVIGNSRQVSIYHKGKLLEVHDRITDPYISKSTKECHKAPWQRSIMEGSYYRKRAAKLGPYVEEIIVRLLMQGNGFIDTRKVWGILALDKKYSADDLNEACQKALSVDAISYRSILTFLQLKAAGQQEDKKEGSASDTKTSKFVRPLEEYQQLLTFGGNKEH